MSQPTAQEQKARHGETSGPQGTHNEGSGSILSIEGGKKIPGEGSLVREISGKRVDLWNDANIKIDVQRLERALSAAKVDANYDLLSFIKNIEYQGFDREFYIKHALTKMSVSVFIRFAIIGAIRGSKFEKISQTCEQMPSDLMSAYTTCSFISATPKKKTDLTILRNTASIPHWCAYWMWKSGTVKKVPDSACPPCLQFPGAASLPMSRSVRLQHLDFSSKFSSLLPGGRFNMNIYMTAYRNTIPIDSIPQEILEFLGVSSNSESHVLSDEEIGTYSKAMVGPVRM
ncbi:NC [Plasmopara viticola lesion associated mycobunyavirales-like virus 4]|uniref:NC n=1 Tax=Plasmopara viticola lesion associated mycobunyavirales-like virus 4 TaxID=2689127 RepID=A0A7H0RQZ6_9VIRU|nr:NC [Plasmopara viticola lesion associated mycobunyavirales-like virus 4]QNQ74050.1 NC [Plasmopara viticola lesion associated mycobunyavirales-like virus 4]